MGQAIFDLNIPVSKTSSALTCFTKDQVAEMEPSACIRCGKVCQRMSKPHHPCDDDAGRPQGRLRDI